MLFIPYQTERILNSLNLVKEANTLQLIGIEYDMCANDYDNGLSPKSKISAFWRCILSRELCTT